MGSGAAPTATEVTSDSGLTRVLDGTRLTLPADDLEHVGVHVHGDSSKEWRARSRAQKGTTNSAWNYGRAMRKSSIARPGTTAKFVFERKRCMVTS